MSSNDDKTGKHNDWGEVYAKIDLLTTWTVAAAKKMDDLDARIKKESERAGEVYGLLAKRIKALEKVAGLCCPNCGYPKAIDDDCANCGRTA